MTECSRFASFPALMCCPWWDVCAGDGAGVQIIAALVQIGAIITERVAFLYRSIAIKLVLQ